MKITGQILKTGIKVTFKNKTVKYIGIKIGAITGSHIKDEKLWVDIVIDKKATAKILEFINRPNICSIEMGNEKWIKKGI